MSDYNQQIEEMLLEEDEVLEIQRDEQWMIRDYNTAVWVDSIVSEREGKVTEIEQIHNGRLEAYRLKMDQWKESASKKYQNDIEFFKNHLHMYHMRVMDEERERNAKKLSTTIKLPTRSLTFKKQQPEIIINGKEASKAKDDADFVQFVKENNPDFIKEEVKWGDYKKTLKQIEVDGALVYVDDAGQKLEFIQLVKRPEKLDWTLNKEQ